MDISMKWFTSVGTFVISVAIIIRRRIWMPQTFIHRRRRHRTRLVKWHSSPLLAFRIRVHPNVNDLTNGPISTMSSMTTEFTCRCHWETGEILFVDQRCAPIIGCKSQDLLHKIIYEQIHPEDQLKFQELFKRTVTQKNLATTASNVSHVIIRFRTNIENEYVSLKASIYAFCNPCTDDIEFLIVTFLSMQPPVAALNNKTSVIANSNDYTRQPYETYARTNTGAHYPTQSPSAYANTDGQEYPANTVTHDGRTYASNNGGSTWAAANDGWSNAASAVTTTATGASAHVVSTSNADYGDTQATMAMYHQFHQ